LLTWSGVGRASGALLAGEQEQGLVLREAQGMSKASFSFVVMTWNRGGQRVTNCLYSLIEYQTEPAVEVVLVDTSNQDTIATDIRKRAITFDRCRFIQIPRNHLYKSWALNVAIKATDPDVDFVAAVDIDFMFGQQLVATLKEKMTPDHFLCTEPRRLPEGADLSDPFSGDNFQALANMTTGWARYGPAKGPLQCAARDWWFKVHGYDERYAKGLGEMDNDTVRRAQKDGLTFGRLTFEEVYPLHQWHPISPLKRTFTKPLPNMRVMANPQGWGQRPK